jgi:2-dehydropantoate 2-reductase
MTTPHVPLRIAVLGAGRIGSAFAFHLARNGRHDVTVIARPGSARLSQLESDGAILTVGGEREPVRVLSELDEAADYDLVIVTLKAYQAEPMLPALRRCAAKTVLFMFNTFRPEFLQEAVGVERCALGMPFIQANLTDEGKLSAIVGSMGQKTLLGSQSWVDVFNASGLPASREPNMALWLRCHVPMCVAFESVSIAGVRRGGGASWGEALALARGVRASFRLIEGLGCHVYPRSKALIAGSPTPVVAAMLWSMSRVKSFRELLATGEGECRALVEALSAEARRSGSPTVVAEIEAMKPA